MDPLSAAQIGTLKELGVTYQELIAYKSKHLVGKQVLMGIIAILVYDYITTFQDEINFLWKTQPRFSAAKLLFIMNRYLPMLGFSLRFVWFQYQTPSRPLCALGDFTAYLAVFNYVVIEVILMLRVWAVAGRSKLLGVFLLTVLITGCSLAFALRKVQPPSSIPLVKVSPISLVLCNRGGSAEFFFECIIGLTAEIP